MKKRHILIPCAVAAMTLGTAMTSWAATGWQEEGGIWCFYNSDGSRAEDQWKKSGNHWFWLDDSGEMLTDSLVEDDEDYFYVNEAGAMVKNEWRELENTDDGDDASDTAWYYFGPNGKAYKAGSSGKTTFKTIGRAGGGSSKYAFDEEGRMLYGWVNEESGRETGEDAWKTGTYYLGEPGDGVLRSGQWERLEVEDDDMDEEEEEYFDGTYWFYFNTNGKKLADTTKKINGRNYRFREDGNTVFKWYNTASGSTATSSNLYYSDPEQCWRASGWFKTIPGETVDQEAYDNGDEYWFYAQKDGELVKSKIKKINGQYYGFNEWGGMLHGLYKMSVNGSDIQSYEEIESENDLPEADEAWQVYYFGDSPKEGVMKTGKTNLDIDGETYTYNFRKSGSDRGAGYDGISDDVLYCKGRVMKADRDEKLAVFTYEDEEYLVNTSGKLQKKKTNVKDADDNFYCTDSRGVVTYKGTEKYTKDND